MRYAVAAVAAFFLAVIYASAMPYWRILGVTPDLILVFAACWAMLRGQGEAMVVVPVAGLLRDLMTSDPLGMSLLALAPIVILAAARDYNPIETGFLPTLALVIAGSLAYGIISMAVLTATGQEIPWATALLRAVLPAAIVNALFTPILYLPLRWATPPQRLAFSKLGPTMRL